MRNWLSVFFRIPCRWQIILPLLFQDSLFSFGLWQFIYNLSQYSSLFEFISLWASCASCMCRFMPFIKIGNFFIYNFLYFFYFFPSVSSLWDSNNLYVGLLDIVSHRSLKFCFLFFSLFSFCCSYWAISSIPSLILLILSCASSILLLHPLVNFYIRYCTFQLQDY